MRPTTTVPELPQRAAPRPAAVALSALRVTQFSIINWERGDLQPNRAAALQRISAFLAYDPAPLHPRTLPEYLLAKRREMGWGQRELAKYLGVDGSTITRWEKGYTILKRAHRTAVADLLGLPVDNIREMAAVGRKRAIPI